MKTMLLALSVLLLLNAPIWGVEFIVPNQKIEVVGGEPIQIGDLVNLKLSPLGDKPKYLETVSYNWQIFEIENNSITEKDRAKIKFVNDEVIFGTGIKTRKVFVQVAVTYTFVEKDKLSISKIETKTILLNKLIQIGGEDIGTNTPVIPNPPPVKPSLESKFGLTKFVYEETIQVDVAERINGAIALSQSFANLSKKITDKQLPTLQDILTTTTKQNKKSMEESGASIDAWQVWSINLQKRLILLHESKKLVSASDYAEAWLEISEGLSEAIKK